MNNALWRGGWSTRLRIVSGLVLFVFAFFHFINIGLGLFHTDYLHGMQDGRKAVTRHDVMSVLFYAALLTHAGLALTSIAQRRTLRMPFSTALQVVLGLLIPLQLISHIVQTRVAHEIYDVNDEMGYIIILMWPSIAVWMQSALLLIVWIHGCIGLHMWLRLTRWWSRVVPYLIGVAVFVPLFALAGLLTEGRRIWADFADEFLREQYIEHYNWPSPETFQTLFSVKDYGLLIFWLALGATGLVYIGRKLWRRRHSVRVNYAKGPEVVAEKGMTLLEISQVNGVPHAALCGGKGRCTTCRVIVEDGSDALPPPGDVEARSLAAVGASPQTRLACQIRPTEPTTVFRVFRPDGGRIRGHASQGQERQLAVLFLDMRSFTARTTGQLPYDIVFLLNRFFDAVVPAITKEGGVVDKYMGDGLLAVFEKPNAAASARAGLQAAIDISHALDEFNAQLEAEGSPGIRIGMGLHLGDLVVGEIGAAGHASKTIIGDAVNVASRLESETKALKVELLVSEELLKAAGVVVPQNDIRLFQLRGVSEPIPALPVTRASTLEQNATEQEQKFSA
ncbi:2Fe-2S iron-sulfur cluster binding domain-containing protein [Ruegeria sp. HKCCD6228]|uniref:adenylate/guanylate cyclase domain-containing protein n=1 Tax=Ruegeria sp. HKCCD6228 TaxID=2683001 RepID=UPI00149136CD|nr:adenylate/guanylate cyclase domain-containing protein [Ruegeria sp. HKCCD6228]NOD97088.1 2Fe-2S iron-sulfur cluster binding domain-containing protein [Ruegeria sp. HKCCD6228]